MAKSLGRQVLEGARVLVAKRTTWTRFNLAITKNNRECEPTDAKAARFCAYGALMRSAFDLTGDARQARELAGKVAMSITERGNPHEAFEVIYTINDGPAASSHSAIKLLFERSLERV